MTILQKSFLSKTFIAACTSLAFSYAAFAQDSTQNIDTDKEQTQRTEETTIEIAPSFPSFRFVMPEEHRLASEEKSRTIRLLGAVTEHSATDVINQMKALSKEDPNADIEFIINSPGGSISAGFAIYDVMRSLPNDIKTVCEGKAMSMGAFLLSAGTQGKRYTYPNCDIMYHQPSWGTNGKITDMENVVDYGNNMKGRMIRIISTHTGWEPHILRDMMEQDFFVDGAEAQQLGFVDHIIQPAKPDPTPAPRTLPENFCDKPGRSYIPACRPKL